MSDAFSRLLKVLTLERQQGYRNKAVIGGLDKFASRWESDAQAESATTGAVREIVALLLGYPAVEGAAARERIVGQILRRIRETGVDGLAEAASYGAAPAEETPAQIGEVPPPPEELRDVQAEGTMAGSSPLERAPESLMPAMSKPSLSESRDQAPAKSDRPAAKPDRVRPARSVGKARSEGAVPKVLEPAPVPSVSKPEPPVQVNEEFADDEALPEAGSVELPEGLAAPVTRLPGVGPSMAQKLARLGVYSVRDLLYLFPRRYDDYSQLRTIGRLFPGEEVTVIGTVWDVESRALGDNRRIVTAMVGDGTGELQMTWFNPYVERRLRVGHAYAFAGKIEVFRRYLVMRNPEFEPLESSQLHTGRLVPVYPLTEGVSGRWLRRILKSAVDAWGGAMPDFLPPGIRDAYDLMPLGDALRQIHFPVNADVLSNAHRRLSFDEFFMLQLGILGQRRRFREAASRPLAADDVLVADFLGSLPFPLTQAQQRAFSEISADLGESVPMTRLLQGDVGSGKTAVAAGALWLAVANGSQGAIMAPTEILAEQHARSFGRLFGTLPNPRAGRPVRIALLTGAIRGAEREELLAALAAGEADIAVGTHALIQEEVAFNDLALVVVDEQHRFGVEQRAALRAKGVQPHLLVMSATPIPRSLALTIYGDLDVSVIDEMPAGRIPVKTKWLAPGQRERAYAFIQRQVAAGRQAFIIYPLVEETNDGGERKAAVEEYERLRCQVFPNLRLGLLHGRMKAEEKDLAMRAFNAGETDILVATSVVEVGIDVPNAAVILIEGAERFGLAQLHQFRGRVGRGEHPSYCILISDAEDATGGQRLDAFESNNDGFALAQIDLDMRGPGDFFGTRQSGLPPLRTARLGDLGTLEAARRAAQEVFAIDPTLADGAHASLASQLAEFWEGTGELS